MKKSPVRRSSRSGWQRIPRSDPGRHHGARLESHDELCLIVRGWACQVEDFCGSNSVADRAGREVARPLDRIDQPVVAERLIAIVGRLGDAVGEQHERRSPSAVSTDAV